MITDTDKPKILSINNRCYPMYDPAGYYEHSENPPTITTVLVEGDIGDYAAYTGIGPPEWVARFGNKIPFKEASVHFPIGLEEKKYRL